MAESVYTPAPDPRPRLPLLPLTILSFLLLYVVTCAPGLLWQDSATFQFRVAKGDYEGDLGLALAHPLYIALAKAFAAIPLGPHAWRVNLFSALCAAVAIGFFTDTQARLTRSVPAALMAAVLLGVSHTFWKHAVIAEVLSLYAAGLAIELWAVERFIRTRFRVWLLLALFVNGIGASNHLLAALHLPAYLCLVLWSLKSRRIHTTTLVTGALAYLLGLLPYLALIGRELSRGTPLGATIHSALFGTVFAKDVLNTSFSLTRQCFKTLQFFALNFPTPLIVAAPFGWWFACKSHELKWLAWFGLGIFLVDFVFAFRYPVADQYVFFIPCYCLWAVFTAIAAAKWLTKSRLRLVAGFAFALLPALAYEVVPPMLKAYKVAVPFRQDVPFRDAYAYFLRPRLNSDVSAERYARAALGQVDPNGLLIADFTINNVLVYARDVLGVRPDVALTIPCDIEPVEPRVMFTPLGINDYASRGLAYINTDSSNYMPSWIFEAYDLELKGVIIRLHPKDPTLEQGNQTTQFTIPAKN